MIDRLNDFALWILREPFPGDDGNVREVLK